MASSSRNGGGESKSLAVGASVQADEALLRLREDDDYDMIKQKWFGPEA